jgi:cyclic-di-AMP phosphodiesterase PgpH
MSLWNRGVRAPLHGFLLKLLAWTEPRSSPTVRREPSFFHRDVRVSARLVAAALWLLTVVVLYQTLGPGRGKALAVVVLTGLVLALFAFTMKRDQPELAEDEEAVALLGLILFTAVWLMQMWVELVRLAPKVSTLGLPLAAAPLLVSLLLSPRLAMVTAFVLSLLYGVVNRFSFDGVLVMILGGTAAVAASVSVRTRRDVSRAGLWIAVTQGLTALSLSLLRNWSVEQTVASWWWALASGVLSVVLVLGVLPVLESFFSRLTSMKLLELCDVNHPLLRRMSVEAPGTYHHSLVMASLASAAAESIGANALLCRAGAYYHDIGKMAKPEYFVENQASLGNPHDPLPPNMSRLVIQSHVKDGIAMARQYGLDPALADFIATHHGTSRIEYFYRRALERTEELETVDEDDYRYPGPQPRSKETAILMMADSVEASVRTLEDPTPQRIRDHIKKIVDQKISDGQFDLVPLTFQDLYRIQESFFNTLMGVYHARIKYPEGERA